MIDYGGHLRGRHLQSAYEIQGEATAAFVREAKRLNGDERLSLRRNNGLKIGRFLDRLQKRFADFVAQRST